MNLPISEPNMERKLFWNSFLPIAALFVLTFTACKSGLSGTYSDTSGAVILELRSDGTANLTFAGQVADCTYTSSNKEIAVKCKGDADPTVFSLHDDGSLTGPAGSFMPALRKQK
jgi:hypothetical protein